MESLMGRTLYSRVSKDATCKVLSVSPGNKRVYFCEITECGIVDYQRLNEKEIWKYYHEANDQDLAPLLESLIKQSLKMPPDRICSSEIRDNEAAGIMLTVSDHPGVITTIHAGWSHKDWTDFLFNKMSKNGMTTLSRFLDDMDAAESQRFLYIEDTREICNQE
ncbi:Flp pilus assembly protein, ATPase CpaF [Desulfosporosinus acidiphilus SJ4]|uniref:Flp pilus assembly protein, ATPase CpaF n=1 Tax=Desulfosporosinus acidiphilus (strain DSM 22704 / JCM 16185 / SJ4) TaxID=646529 RepID=I4DAX0_DESAJ|nr:ATPase, T2SS/T4P/T4SS family [Desulfosporosinus acidiphilus]AFM42944.1 Flp pilus assembly protein, ATPase CpaF [Desulfosporosinus acidiphilus SJ4]